MTIFTSLIAGLVFGLGLIVSGMANPAKILGFLDVAGAWDPSLLFVMGGAVAVASVAFAIARKRTVSLLGAEMKLPTARQIDRRLVGWGIAGFCPGPSLVALGMAEPKASCSWPRCWLEWADSNCSSGASRTRRFMQPEIFDLQMLGQLRRYFKQPIFMITAFRLVMKEQSAGNDPNGGSLTTNLLLTV